MNRTKKKTFAALSAEAEDHCFRGGPVLFADSRSCAAAWVDSAARRGLGEEAIRCLSGCLKRVDGTGCFMTKQQSDIDSGRSQH